MSRDMRGLVDALALRRARALPALSTAVATQWYAHREWRRYRSSAFPTADMWAAFLRHYNTILKSYPNVRDIIENMARKPEKTPRKPTRKPTPPGSPLRRSPRNTTPQPPLSPTPTERATSPPGPPPAEPMGFFGEYYTQLCAFIEKAKKDKTHKKWDSVLLCLQDSLDRLPFGNPCA